MNIVESQIDGIRQEVGKPRKDRGLKVRQAAIRFEEHFRDKIFDAEEFWKWMESESELNRFDDAAKARRALQQAGTRTDLPRAFEIIRIGKSSWALHPPEDYFLRGEFPKAMSAFLQKENRKVKQLLQAIDWDNLEKHARLTVTSQYQFYKASIEFIRVGASHMRVALDGLSAGFLSFEQKELPNGNNES